MTNKSISTKTNYWDERYSSGGSSGRGSTGNSREWKWQIIESVLETDLDEILDVGCGDLQFFQGKEVPSYTGIDISKTIVQKNSQLRPEWTFIVSPADVCLDLSAKTVFCMDVLFHIINEEEYQRIIHNLTCYSEKWIVIYNWWRNPFRLVRYIYKLVRKKQFRKAIQAFLGKIDSDNLYQKYRNFEKYFQLFAENQFKLVAFHKAPRHIDKFGAIYIFKKR